MIYLDSCILIYALEDATARGDAVRAALAATDDLVAASPLVLHECLVGPLKARNLELRQRYLDVYERLHHLELDGGAFVQAAELRAAFPMRTPDALHLAAAQRAGCTALWTNDRRFAASSQGLAINLLDALG